MTKKFLLGYLLSLLLVLQFSSVGQCSRNLLITDEQLTTIENHLIALKENSETQSQELTLSKQDLTVALKALSVCQEELATLKAQYNQSKKELATVRQSLMTASEELQNVKQYVKTLERNQQKRHDIKLGVAYIYNDVYGSLSYRNRNIEYSVLYAKQGKAGFEIKYTLFSW